MTRSRTVAATVKALPLGTLFIATWRGGIEPDLRVREGESSRVLYDEAGQPYDCPNKADIPEWETTVIIHPLTEDDGARLLAVLALNCDQGLKLMHKLSR